MMGQRIPKAIQAVWVDRLLLCWIALIQDGFSGQAGKATGEGMLVYPFRAETAERLQQDCKRFCSGNAGYLQNKGQNWVQQMLHHSQC
jgi:hypothetical protein